ncbi:MAG TPA: restriction endonuclease subunit S [Ghiorsea sp.]|nr:restriction endonuclease subunit S [Ghiorsea sp.]
MNGAHPYLQIDEVRGVLPTKFAEDPKGVEVTPDDLCIVWDGANAGTVGYGVTGLIGSTVARMRLIEPSKWETRFLGRLLEGKFRELNDQAQARGATIPHVDKNKLEEIRLPKLDPEDQRRIAAILDKADDIRRKREQALALADDFLRSLFLDMFGDPVTNPKGWDECTLDEIADIASGLTKGRKIRPDQSTRAVPYMRVANVQDGHLALNEIKKIEATEVEIERYLLKANDILLTEGGDPDKLGRGSVWSGEIDECIHQNHIFRVRLNADLIHPLILQNQIGSQRGKRYFLRAAKQTTGIASINKTQLSKYPVLLPSKAAQENYLVLAKKVQTTINSLQFSADESSDLFSSLSQRAFRGEL